MGEEGGQTNGSIHGQLPLCRKRLYVHFAGRLHRTIKNPLVAAPWL